MTDRVNAFIVYLEKDIREDDVESLVAALYQMKFVLNVEKNVVGSNIDVEVEGYRQKKELFDKIYNLFWGS